MLTMPRRTSIGINYRSTGYVAALNTLRIVKKDVRGTITAPTDPVSMKLWKQGFISCMTNKGLLPIPKGCTRPPTKLQRIRRRRAA